MRSATRQSLELPPLQGIYHDKRSAPLQIRNFTPESYEALKKRERRNTKKWKSRNTRERTDARTLEQHPCRCHHTLEFVPSDLRFGDVVFIGSSASRHAKRVAQISRPVPTETELEATPTATWTSSGVVAEQGNSEGHIWVPTPPAAGDTTAGAEDDATNPELVRETPQRIRPAYPFDAACKVAAGHGYLAAAATRSGTSAWDQEGHAAAPSQPAPVVTGMRRELDSEIHFHDASSSTKTITQYRAVSNLSAATELKLHEKDAPQRKFPATDGIHQSYSQSSEQADLVLVRDIGQSNHRSTVTSCPNTRPGTVEHRHQQLSTPTISRRSRQGHQDRSSTSGVHTPPSTPAIKPGGTATVHRAPSCRKARATARHSTTRWTARPTCNVNVVTASEPMIELMSRRGRPIKHPFRHRPNEGSL